MTTVATRPASRSYEPEVLFMSVTWVAGAQVHDLPSADFPGTLITGGWIGRRAAEHKPGLGRDAGLAGSHVTHYSTTLFLLVNF